MATENLSPTMAGLGLGIALAGTPGPVQAVLLGEALRGGMARGFRAMAGANLTFAVLLIALALGFSAVPPSDPVVRTLKVVGGLFIVWLALDGFRSAHEVEGASTERPALPPAARGALAVLLNPGAWLFLATAASSLFAAAIELGGRGSALFAAGALIAGLAVGDGAVVLLGGFGRRRAGGLVGVWVRRGLATVLAALGAWLVVTGLIS